MCMPKATILSGEKLMYEHTESRANGNNIWFFSLQDQHHSTEALLALCILWETFIFHHTTIQYFRFQSSIFMLLPNVSLVITPSMG